MNPYVGSPAALHEPGNTVLLVKQLGDLLERHYPGWLWTIQPETKQGMLFVRALRLSGRFGLALRIVDIQNDLPRAKRLAGQLLERYGARRGPYSYDNWRQIRRDAAGLPLGDLSDRVSRHTARKLELSGRIAEGKAQVVERNGQGILVVDSK